MLISLNWIRDFVDLPADLDAAALAERFTVTTAEVDEVKRVSIGARGLIAARIQAVSDLPETRNAKLVVLNVGNGKNVQTVSNAPVLPLGAQVVFAPTGAAVNSLGTIGSAKVAGQTSEGMILPGESIGIEMAVQEAIFLGPDVEPGAALSPELFDDWLVEIDNKSITHRPDLWGHYGIAREIAAILGVGLKPYPTATLSDLADEEQPAIEINIADAKVCRRFSCIRMEGVPTIPAPLWMQLRLGRVGMRPINALVDLTNYVMADLGQPMHAFDAAKVPQIEVDWATNGEPFRTLDGMERELSAEMLMVKSQGGAVSLAGVMGGLDTEVADKTTALLLESANWEPAVIRRTATRLGLRTDASARFEKSLDPVHTVLSIQRFVHLARDIYPELTFTSRLSDSFPMPFPQVTVPVAPMHVSRVLGREVALAEARNILAPLEFEVHDKGDNWEVLVPSFRATNDVSIEADVIEELARFIGFATIEPTLPRVTVRRFERDRLHDLERQTLSHFSTAGRFIEIHGYIWYDAHWLTQLQVDPGTCLELSNPAAEGLERLRQTLMPGMLASVAKNRFHFPAFSLMELGSVFRPDPGASGSAGAEYRHAGLVMARRGKQAETDLLSRLKGSIEGWAWESFGGGVTYETTDANRDRPWEHAQRTAKIQIAGVDAGRISVVTTAFRRKMDEHLAAWSIAWAELHLHALLAILKRTERLGSIPDYPLVEMDFSFLVKRSDRYDSVLKRVGEFDHPLLRQVRYVGSYEGKSVDPNQRSLTIRTVIGDAARTLVDEDTGGFRKAFEAHLSTCGFEIRG